MISKKYLNQALRIRKDFLSTDDELLMINNKLKSINEDIQKTLKQLIEIRGNSSEYKTDDKFQTDIIECLKDFEIQSKKVSEIYEPLNDKMENLKQALTTLIIVTEKTDRALIDGKINIAEGVSIAMSAIGLINVVKNIKPLFEEYQLLPAEDLSQLNIWFEQEFDMENENVEQIIEMIFSALLSLGVAFDNLALCNTTKTFC